MGSNRSGEFAHDSLQDMETIGKYLEALAQGFRKGRLQFSSGKRVIELEPHGLLELSVRAKRKGSDTRVAVQVSWKEEPAKKSRSVPLRIKVPRQRE